MLQLPLTSDDPCAPIPIFPHPGSICLQSYSKRSAMEVYNIQRKSSDTAPKSHP